MRQLFIILFIAGSVLLSGCKFFGKTAKDAPTEEEKVEAIKETLKQGVGKAIGQLGLDEGSFKIELPEGAKSVAEYMRKLPKGNEMVDNTMLQINKAAEMSVKTLGPVINAAIDNMTVEEANKILLSDSAAATAYLQKAARPSLHAACEPIIISSIDITIVGDYTTRDAWNNFAKNYNGISDTKIGKISGLKPVDVDIDGYVTDQVLDAVFSLVAKEEMNIRKHPASRLSQSMIKTFGWLDKETDK